MVVRVVVRNPDQGHKVSSPGQRVIQKTAAIGRGSPAQSLGVKVFSGQRRNLGQIKEAEQLSSDYFTLAQEQFLRRWMPGRGTELRRQTTGPVCG